MSMLKEFKDFAIKGNMIDMAVGIIMGGAFGKVVSALVSGIIMPPVGKMLGGVNFSDLFISLDPEKTRGIASLAGAEATGAALITYGAFFNTIINFVILAACIFVLVKIVNSAKKKEEAAPAAPPAQEVLLGEIRDLLKK